MLEAIKKIRQQTGAGVIDIKKALEEAEGDEKKAVEIIRKKGLEKADKKGDREAGEGMIASYVHTNGKVAALVKIFCETDFVARNEDFQAFAKDVAMQVAAMNPISVSADKVDQELVDDQKKTWKEEIEKEGKPAEVAEKIMQGKEQKFRNENALLGQKFIKDQDLTVEEVLKEKISTVGENIIIDSFVRLEL